MRTIEYIERVVCAGEKIMPDGLHTPSRKRYIKDIRQLIMTLAIEFGNTQDVAGRYFDRDHCTALNARNVINDLYDTDCTWRQKIDMYRNIIKSELTFDIWNIGTRKSQLVKETADLLDTLQKIAI